MKIKIPNRYSAIINGEGQVPYVFDNATRQVVGFDHPEKRRTLEV